MRLGILGPEAKGAFQALNAWVRQWESIIGGNWWSFARVRNGLLFSRQRVLEFREVYRNHDFEHFHERKERRNISSREQGFVYPLPERHEHPGFPYATSPAAGHVPAASLGSVATPLSPSSPARTPAPTLRLPHGFRGSPEKWARTVAQYEEIRRRVAPSTPSRAIASIRGAAAIPAPLPSPTRRTDTLLGSPLPPSSPSGPHPQLNPAHSDLVVGHARGQLLRLPPGWNHLAVLGRTQTGKSTLVLNLVLQLLLKRPDATVIVLEPTGGFILDVLRRIDPGTAAETIQVDPAHATFREGGLSKVSVPLGILHLTERDRRDLDELERRSEMVAGDILLSIKNAWGEDSIGARADFILRPILQGLLATRGTNLVDAYYVLSDAEVRRRFLRTLPEGPSTNFLRVHLPGLDYAFTMSSLNKVGKIATNPMLRKALCQRVHAVPFEDLLKHRLLLLNLSKGELGTEGSNFLGAIFLTQLWAALQRSGSKEHPVYLVVDEFQNYAVPIFKDMLSEGAKFGLHVVAVTQYLHQVDEKIQAALHGNVSAWLFLALGVEDMQLAWKVADGERRGWVPQDFVNGLPNHQVAMAAGGSFCKMETFPAPPPRPDAPALAGMVERSTRRYARLEDSEVSPLQTAP
ncbi:MAG: TraM recognition domain-containing protein, partial [Euryarchaeota archaeon]|nr:TraM recognition domain-containing protein [Euryarchaeota archaeon]